MTQSGHLSLGLNLLSFSGQQEGGGVKIKAWQHLINLSLRNDLEKVQGTKCNLSLVLLELRRHCEKSHDKIYLIYFLLKLNMFCRREQASKSPSPPGVLIQICRNSLLHNVS